MDQLFAERSAADEKVCCADCRQRESVEHGSSLL